MISLLFISYHFPPQGGAGVQRSLKFAKYLTRFGIRPVILTTQGHKKSKWTPEDETLLRDLPGDTEVIRIEWKKNWREEADFARVKQALGDLKFDAVFASMSPFADCALAEHLSRHLGCPWIADLRDPWALDEYQIYRHRWQKKVEFDRMGRALASAAGIVMNTPTSADLLTAHYPHLREKAVTWITNGFDKEDFEAPLPPREANSQFTVVHAGFLHTEGGLRQQRQNLKNVLLGSHTPGVRILPRSHYYLLQAIERWLALDPSIAHHVRVTLAGVAGEADTAILEDSPARSLFSFTGYLDHLSSVNVLRTAQLLFLPMHTVPAGQRASIVPGKTYEYLASNVPILAAIPAGDARDFLCQGGGSFVTEPEDVTSMLYALRSAYEKWQRGERPVDRTPAIASFERQALTQRLADFIRRVLSTKNSSVAS